MLVGLATFIGGTIALFTIENSAGSLFVITVGMVLALVALLGNRVQLESFELLGANVKVREVVKGRLQLAESPDVEKADSRSSLARAGVDTAEAGRSVRPVPVRPPNAAGLRRANCCS